MRRENLGKRPQEWEEAGEVAPECHHVVQHFLMCDVPQLSSILHLNPLELNPLPISFPKKT